jgi:hypothetical protein
MLPPGYFLNLINNDVVFRVQLTPVSDYIPLAIL